MPWLLTDRIPFYLNCNAYREIPRFLENSSLLSLMNSLEVLRETRKRRRTKVRGRRGNMQEVRIHYLDS